MIPTNDTEFAELWERAKISAQSAAVVANNRLPPESQRGFDCGFAWVTLPGNTPFARWLKRQGIASKSYPRGLQIWYSKLHNLPTQSVSVHRAAAEAACDVLSHGLQTSTIGTGSRLD